MCLVDRDAEAGRVHADALGGESAIFCEADVTDEASVEAAVRATVAEWGQVNGAVNAAGVATARRLLKTPLDELRQVLDVNVVGSVNVVQATAKAMLEADVDAESGERGVFVNTASVAAYDGQIGQASYAASKGAIVALTLTMARELAEHSIRVNTIAPGIMDTPMLAGLPEKARISLGKQVPFPQRMGDPAEYAKAVVSIIDNGYWNGEVLRLDGAIRMAPK